MHQENGNTKQLKLRIPMQLFFQLKKDAEYHRTDFSTHARHILMDALMNVEITEEDKKEIKRLVDENWDKIRGAKK